ncbi:hypothetical protein PSN45_004432 [Yamadazyma tenuis]|uniref:Cyclin-like domain-containing protein n=1 Tax=Candida tenuis (strain ATCC 10573 / BCRC 21748 / CBS 615 / JCM 9827 / NBRC 10315 / NRRL Y-1498 / VKM Y-70) TaxID=590646 RepID=G3B5S7_CANTC|nr:uncharacterized protein CANTEDRAFT_114592 [Yamadazyma tenuis ATCC 10573]EGV63293.1 hypothetical protein CANTEDRAFT_114592 [Yamadazyma tenuis ATCC 10573]WEJ96887.1 hypothetical protein PSN45_004432 [Yamadazyma tenuis]
MDEVSHNRLYGPPQRLPLKSYPRELESLETIGNKKLIKDYKKNIKSFMARLESNNDINPAMIDLQPEIQWFMRPFLLDYIIELHGSFRLQAQTLFRCFNIIDRYCAKRIVFKRHYQLVGCTALWIAAKYEDKKSRVPTLKELSIMCRNAYDEEMFIQMERHVLSTLEWSLERPTLEDCLQLAIDSFIGFDSITPIRNSSDNSIVSATTAVTRFLCELSLYHRDFLNFETCIVASAANLLALSMLKVPHGANYVLGLISTKLRVEANADTEDLENVEPEIYGSFLTGFDEHTLIKVRRVSLMLAIFLEEASEVLTTKYKPLGVMSVVENFIDTNHQIFEKLRVHKTDVTKIDEENFEANTPITLLVDILLNMHESYDGEFVHDAPITPPSISRSIFSDLQASSPSFGTPTVYNIGKGSQSSLHDIREPQSCKTSFAYKFSPDRETSAVRMGNF